MKITKISIDKINPDPDQPRKTFENIGSLLGSILKEGLIEPLKVKKEGSKYIIIDGERRFRALSKLAEKDDFYNQVDCIVMETDQMFITQLTTDIHKNKLDPFEEASAFEKLLKEGWELDELKTRLGVETSRITRKIKLLGFNEHTRELIKEGDIPESVITAMDFKKFKKSEEVIVGRIKKETNIRYGRLDKNRKRKIIRQIIDEETNKEEKTIEYFLRTLDDFKFSIGSGLEKIKKLELGKKEIDDYLETPLKEAEEEIQKEIEHIKKVNLSTQHLEGILKKIRSFKEDYGANFALSEEIVKEE